MDESGSSLRELFSSAKGKQEELDSGTATYQETLQSAISAYEQCRQLISRLAIFSPNEEVEDISTQDLQYLTVDYLLAELLTKSYGSDRAKTLQNVLQLYEAFLSRLDNYSILSDQNRKLYERFLESRSLFQLASTSNVEERRKVKVARFQQEKSLKAKLEHLRTKSGSNHADDEVLRELYLTEIESYANQTFQSLDLVTQENNVLSQARLATSSSAQNQPDSRDSDLRDPDSYSERLDGLLPQARRGGPLLSTSGKPLQPFTLTNTRTQLRDGVFRPGHNLPTMSIDEYLEEEKRRGGIIDGGGNPAPAPEIDEDNMALADAETMKAREWDEFKEANPKGSGNTLNRG